MLTWRLRRQNLIWYLLVEYCIKRFNHGCALCFHLQHTHVIWAYFMPVSIFVYNCICCLATISSLNSCSKTLHKSMARVIRQGSLFLGALISCCKSSSRKYYCLYSSCTVTNIIQTTFSNSFSWMKVYEFRLKCHCSISVRAKLLISQHWFS